MSDSPTDTTREQTAAKPVKRRWRKKEQEVPRWDKSCLCGKELAGFRAESPQILKCPDCDQQHFILPINPYPEPKRVRKKRKKQKRQGEPLGRKVERLSRQTGRGLFSLLTLALSSLWKQLHRLVQKIRQEMTPLRLTMVSIVCVAALGGYVAIRQQQQNRAVQLLRESVEAGEAAVADGQWGTATNQYALAAEAIRTLRREDRFAAEVLQKHRELQAIQQLCMLNLDDVIEVAEEPNQTSTNWNTYFRLQVQNRWLIVETWLAPTQVAEDGSLIQTLPVAETVVDLHWPRALLKPLPESDYPMHVLVAGQFQEISTSPSPTTDWKITIAPETAFLWCFPETTEPLNFELESPWLPQDSLRVAIKRQQQAVLGEIE